jgi:hypothetical protein
MFPKVGQAKLRSRGWEIASRAAVGRICNCRCSCDHGPSTSTWQRDDGVGWVLKGWVCDRYLWVDRPPGSAGSFIFVPQWLKQEMELLCSYAVLLCSLCTTVGVVRSLFHLSDPSEAAKRKGLGGRIVGCKNRNIPKRMAWHGKSGLGLFHVRCKLCFR